MERTVHSHFLADHHRRQVSGLGVSCKWLADDHGKLGYILAIVAKVRDCNWFCDFVLTLRSMQNNVQRYVAGLCPTSRPCMLCLQSPKVFLMATGM